MAPGDPRHRSSTLLCAVERKGLEAASRSAMWLKEWAGAVFFLLSACLPMPLLPLSFGTLLVSAGGLSIAIPVVLQHVNSRNGTTLALSGCFAHVRLEATDHRERRRRVQNSTHASVAVSSTQPGESTIAGQQGRWQEGRVSAHKPRWDAGTSSPDPTH